MAKAFSNTLRRQLLHAYASGEGTLRELAERFNVSLPYAFKIRRQQLRTGSIDRPLQSRHGPASAITMQVEKRIRIMLRKNPDITLNELRTALASSGVALSKSRISQKLKALGLKLTKKRFMTAAARKRISEGQKKKWASRREPTSKLPASGRSQEEKKAEAQ